MALRLIDGDYVPDGSGELETVSGRRELLQRVLFKLQARRGRYPFMPRLGSLLSTLPREKASRRQELARAWAEQALEEENVTVEKVELLPEHDHTLPIRVTLRERSGKMTIKTEVRI